MNYQFPKIRCLDDVLPAIAGYDEFVVSDKDDFIVVNYVVTTDKTFVMTGPDDLDGAIRRECRGLKFSPDGRIMARPFHKFFNVNEREETQVHNLKWSNHNGHVITTKLDGSMIHPVTMKTGDIRWATKMGITTVAMQAEEFIAQHVRFQVFAEICRIYKWTPIFEWTSPQQQIVIRYPEDSLTLLAVRENVTGKYLKIHGSS